MSSDAPRERLGSKVSIIIDNYNYGRFLRQAIESVLAQDDENIEVILVDDGSTDDSVAIAKRLASPRIRLIEKSNGGQPSAFNAGFAASTGEWIMFLDADDWYEPDAVRTVRQEFREGVAKVHFPLIQHDEAAGRSGEVFPKPLFRGDAAGELVEKGYYVWPPTTGNVFRRDVLERLMPIPESEYRSCADLYLCLRIAAYGVIAAVDRPLGHYRIHGANAWFQTAFSLDRRLLYTRGRVLLLYERLTRELGRETGRTVATTVMDLKENVEIVAICHRFAGLRLEEFGYTKKSLAKHWRRRCRASLASVRSRILAFLVWQAIHHAPAAVLVRVMRQRERIWRRRRLRRESALQTLA